MNTWKLATILLVASVIAFFTCLISAASTWQYLLPRTAFLNSSYFFGLAAITFFSVTFFLDDLAEWIKKISAVWVRGILTITFSLIFTFLMTLGLYFFIVAGISLKPLKQCGFEIIDEICTQKQANLTEQQVKKISKTEAYYITFGNNPQLKQIFEIMQID